jgi:Tol biopolymer transport system component
MTWRPIEAQLDSSEVAAIIAVLCQHCVVHGHESIARITADDLSISEDGDLVVQHGLRAGPEPATAVLIELVTELVQRVDSPDLALSMLSRPTATGDVAPVSDVAELGMWMQHAFALTDSRSVLRPIALRMAGTGAVARERGGPNIVIVRDRAALSRTVSTPPGRHGRRIAIGLALLVAGLFLIPFTERLPKGVIAGPARRVPSPAESTSARATAEPSTTVDADRTAPVAPVTAAAPRSADRVESPPPRAARPRVEPPSAVAARSLSSGSAVPLATPGITAPVFSPSFDAQGSSVFFHVGRSSRGQLAEGKLDADHQLVQVTALTQDGSRNYHARLSPDGNSVAFDSDREGERAVYIARRDGSDVRRVSGPGFGSVPTWSPDGSRLAFVRGEPTRSSVWNLWLLDVASGKLERVTSYPYGQLWGASWFPGGDSVAYSHETSLYVLDLTSGRRERFDSPVPGRTLRTPAVSPDGGRIVFQVQGDGAWMLELADRSVRRILADPSAEEFTWDPRGARVAYHSRRDGQWRLWITAAAPTPPAGQLGRLRPDASNQ